MGSLQKNTAYFTLAMVFQKIITIAYFWYISQKLIPDSLGQYLFALSFATLFAIIVDLGMLQVLTRESAKNLEKAGLYLRNVLSLKIPLSFLAFGLVVLWLVIFPRLNNSVIYLAALVMILDSLALTLFSPLRARQNFKYESLSFVLTKIITAGIGVVILQYTENINYLILAIVIGSLCNNFYATFLLKFKFKFNLYPAVNRKILLSLLKMTPAFLLAGLFIKVYDSSFSVMLGYLQNDASVAFYGIPAKVIVSLQNLIPVAVGATIYPAMSDSHLRDQPRLKRIFEKSFKYLLVVSIVISLALFLGAKIILQILWPQYLDSLLTFRVMMLSLPFIFLAFPTGNFLNATSRQKTTTINRGIMTAVAVVLNIILIPEYGFLGAGVSLLVSSVVVFGLDVWAVKMVLYS